MTRPEYWSMNRARSLRAGLSLCLAILLCGAGAFSALAQPESSLDDAPGLGRLPGAPGERLRPGMARSAFAASALADPIAMPFAPTVSLPEDAAWEGWTAPGVGYGSCFTEYHGKLYIGGVNAAGHVAAGGIVSWDGARFEAAPPLGSSTGIYGMTVWNDHLIVSTYNPTCVLMMNGAVWDTLGYPGTGAFAMTTYGGDLVIGGSFTSIDGVAANRVARWNGSTWSALGTGLTGAFDRVDALTVHAGQLVAGGSLTTGHVKVFNEPVGDWETLGLGFNSTVSSLASDGVTLYAAGAFTLSGAAAVVRNARWDGASWLPVGPAFSSAFKNNVTLWNGGAVFDRPMGDGHLAFWNGASLTSMADSIGLTGSFQVFQLGRWGQKLVVLGFFDSRGQAAVPHLLLYDGVIWSFPIEPWDDQMLSPVGGEVTDLISWGGKLIFGGNPQFAAERDHFVYCPGAGAWDGQHWSSLGGKYLTTTYKFFGTYQGDLITIGHSGLLGYVARWDGTTWSKFGTNPPRWGTDIQEFHGDLYVGHDWVDGPTGGIARWDGASWQSVGGDLSQEGDPVLAYTDEMCLWGDSMVVVGKFDHAGGVSAANIAVWDGVAWHAIPDSFTMTLNYDTPLWTVANWNGHLVLGGVFTGFGGQPLTGAAIWDGSTWQQLGTNVVSVGWLRVADGVLFASGQFRLPDGTLTYSVARWTGSDWHVLGSGTSWYQAFTVHDGYLYATGTGLVNGHLSHGLSRIPLYATLETPRPRAQASGLALSVSPNPARGSIALSFSLPVASRVRLTLLDVSGREVARPLDRELAAGPHQVAWPTAGAPGIYFARLESPSGIRTTRFVVLGR